MFVSRNPGGIQGEHVAGRWCSRRSTSSHIFTHTLTTHGAGLLTLGVLGFRGGFQLSCQTTFVTDPTSVPLAWLRCSWVGSNVVGQKKPSNLFGVSFSVAETIQHDPTISN